MSYDYPDEEIIKRTRIALGILQKNDLFLLRVKAHERSIAHKLAEYLQEQFPDWNVDCEYNRMRNMPKLLDRLEDFEECKGHRKSNRVFPDIIVHKRNTEDNLLVVELKKSNLDPKCDIKKLELFTEKDHFHYSLGLFIEFEDSQLKLEWFKDGKHMSTSDK
jgi:hypothetical protein